MSSYSKSRAAGVALLVTIIEDAGLIAWLALVRGSIAYAGIPIPAFVLLLVLLVEHSIMQRAENPSFTGKTFARIFGFTLLEVVNWSVWLTLLSNTTTLLSMSSLVASLYFFVGFYIEHQITENVITDQPYLRFKNDRGVITAGVLLETISEGVGARLWILYATASIATVFVGSLTLGITLLVLGSLIEHSIQYVVGRVPVTSPILEQKSV